LVFITEMKSVYSAVRTGDLNEAVCAPSVTVDGSQPRTVSLLLAVPPHRTAVPTVLCGPADLVAVFRWMAGGLRRWLSVCLSVCVLLVQQGGTLPPGTFPRVE
jgi:hypothetical protein